MRNNVFLGVQDMGYVKGLVSSAESVGQEIYRQEALRRGDTIELENIRRAMESGKAVPVPARADIDDEDESGVISKAKEARIREPSGEHAVRRGARA